MKRIIIVEDDPSILDTFGIILNGQYKLDLYTSADTLMASNYEIPDLFIIDKQLSGTSGTSLCMYLKSNEPTSSVPVILVSASPEIHRVASEAGADGALEKPFRVKALRELIKSFLP